MLSNIVVDLVQAEDFKVEDISVRKASLLDIAFIFELMLEGAFFGAFSDSFMQPTGSFKLLVTVFKLWFNQYRWLRIKYHPRVFLMITKDKQEVGFVYLESVTFGVNKVNYLVLSLMSILKSYRNKNIGSDVVLKIYNAIPPGAIMVVSCTKYSVVMKKILKKLKFKTAKNNSLGLVEFTKEKLSG